MNYQNKFIRSSLFYSFIFILFFHSFKSMTKFSFGIGIFEYLPERYYNVEVDILYDNKVRIGKSDLRMNPYVIQLSKRIHEKRNNKTKQPEGQSLYERVVGIEKSLAELSNSLENNLNQLLQELKPDSDRKTINKPSTRPGKPKKFQKILKF